MADRRWRHDERHLYDAGRCEHCGARRRVEWVEVDASEDMPGTWWVPGELVCTSANCGP